MLGKTGHWSAFATAQFVEAGVHGDAVRPCTKRRSAVEACDAAHDGDECFLAGVGGVGIVSG
jgi:hypothetical protein